MHASVTCLVWTPLKLVPPPQFYPVEALFDTRIFKKRCTLIAHAADIHVRCRIGELMIDNQHTSVITPTSGKKKRFY